MGIFIGCLPCTIYDGDCWDTERKDTTSGQTSSLVWWVILEDQKGMLNIKLGVCTSYRAAEGGMA